MLLPTAAAMGGVSELPQCLRAGDASGPLPLPLSSGSYLGSAIPAWVHLPCMAPSWTMWKYIVRF